MTHKQLAVRRRNAITGRALARPTTCQPGVLTKRTHFGIGTARLHQQPWLARRYAQLLFLRNEPILDTVA